MDVYQTEEEQIETIKKWWAENGKSIILGVILGLVGLFGWRSWQGHVVKQAAAASAIYQQLVTDMANGKIDDAEQTANEITGKYAHTEYAVFSKLILAKIAVEAGKLDAAAGHLRWALKHNSQPSMDREIRLRLARILTAEKKYDAAVKALDVRDPGEYLASYQELRGDIAAKQGHKEAARDDYEQALNAVRAAGSNTSILETKLDNLGINAGS